MGRSERSGRSAWGGYGKRGGFRRPAPRRGEPLRILARSSAAFEPPLDLPALLGERAREARRLIPKIRAHLEDPRLSRGLYNRLAESRKGGLGRFNGLRNKAAHWMAPVPARTTLELRRFYREVLSELVPLAANHLREVGNGAQRQSLERWADDVLEAAKTQVKEDWQPLSYGRARILLEGRGR